MEVGWEAVVGGFGEVEEFSGGGTAEAFVGDFALIGCYECRVDDAARSGQLKYFLSQCHDVVGKAGSFVSRVEASHQPGILSCDSRRTMPRVATLSLDAAD